MRVHAVICLLFPFLIQTVGAVDLSSCYNSSIRTDVVANDPKKFYAGLNPFYSINKGIADGIQKTMDNQTLQDIYNYIEGIDPHKNIGTVINEVIKEQAGAIVFFCVGLAIILAALVIGVVVCSCRCCCDACGADKKEGYPSPIGVFGMLFGLVACFTFVLTGLVIFNLSANNLYFAIDESIFWINDTVNGIDNSVIAGTNETQCTVQKSVDDTFTQLEGQMNNFSTILLDQMMIASGVADIQNFDYDGFNTTVDAMTQLSKQISDMLSEPTNECSTAYGNISEYLGMLDATLPPLRIAVFAVQIISNNAVSSLNSSIPEAEISQQTTQVTILMNRVENGLNDQMNKLTSQVNDSLNIVRDIQTAIDKAQNKAVTWSGYKPVKAGWQALVSIPSCICLLFCLLTIVGLVYWLVQGEKKKSMGYAAICGFYFTIFLTIVAMGVTSTAFVAGWAVSGVCQPMFEDQNFAILSLANLPNITILGLDGTATSTTVQQLMTRCEAKQTVFQAIGGNDLINVDMVNQFLNLSQVQQQLDQTIQNNTVTYDIPTDAFTNLTNQAGNLSTLRDFFNNASQQGFEGCNQMSDALKTELQNMSILLNTSYYQVQQLLGYMNTSMNNAGTMTQTTVDIVNQQFNFTTGTINSSITDMLNGLNNDAFPCYPLYQSYENAGTIVCDWFGRPIHGMWGAAGLAAIFFIPAAFLMLCAAKVLFTGKRSKSQAVYKEDKEVPQPVGVTRTQKAWDTDDSDIFRRPQIHSDPMQTSSVYNQTTSNPYSQPATVVDPWMMNSRPQEGFLREDNSVGYSGVRRLGKVGGSVPPRLNRIDDGWDADSFDGDFGTKGLRRM